MKKRSIITAAISVAMAATLVMGAISSIPLEKAEASIRLSGVQQVVDELNNDTDATFNVVEIVPDYAFSSMGYLVSGYEPTISEKILKQYSTKTSREQAVNVLLSGLQDAGIISGFQYSESLYQDAEKQKVLDFGTEIVYENRTGRYVKKEEASGLVNATGANYDYSPLLAASASLYVLKNGSAVTEPAVLVNEDYVPEVGDELFFRVGAENLTSSEKTNLSVDVLSADGTVVEQNASVSLLGVETKYFEHAYTIQDADKGQQISFYGMLSDGSANYYTKQISVTVPRDAETRDINVTVTHSMKYETDTEGNFVDDGNGNKRVLGEISFTPTDSTVDVTAF